MILNFLSKKLALILLVALLMPTVLVAQTSDSVNVGLTVTNVNTGGGGGEGGQNLISGWIYEDLNINGSRSGEPGLQNWEVYLYQNNNLLSTVETFGSNGIFFFNNVADGNYLVCEDLPQDSNGWFQTDPTENDGSSWRAQGSNPVCPNGTYGYEINVAAGVEAYGVDFGNARTSTEGVPNVTNFTATPNNGVINLTWDNPVYANLAAVRIIRLAGQIPLSPDDGVLIYDGTGESVIDTDVVPGVTYYYAAFVRNNTGQYSSGALASARFTLPAEEEPPGEDPPPGGEEPGNPNVFDSFPSAIDESLPPVALLFSQPSLGSQRYVSPDKPIYIRGDEELTVFLPKSLVPNGLKTIGLTLFAPGDNNRSFSFILRLNDEGTGYTATLAPLGYSGSYKFTLHIINYKNQQIQRQSGTLVVSAAGALPLPLITGTASKAVVGLGVAVGIAQLLLVTTQAKSLVDLWLIILRGIAALLGYAGVRRRRQPWGVVYDSITKRPIDPAVVTVQAANKEFSSAITDIDGRYGFYLPMGKYVMTAGKTHYQFPSQILVGQASDPIYPNLYFGEEIVVAGEGEIINRNIPLDPIGFDWNEFIKNKASYFKLNSNKSRQRTIILNVIYLAGFILGLVHFFTSPEMVDLIILVAYVAVYLAQRYWQVKYPVISLKRASGERLPFSVIRVFLAGVNQEVKKVITDDLSKFYLLVRPGDYYFTVEEKLPDASYKEIYRSAPMTLKTGVLNKDLIIP